MTDEELNDYIYDTKSKFEAKLEFVTKLQERLQLSEKYFVLLTDVLDLLKKVDRRELADQAVYNEWKKKRSQLSSDYESLMVKRYDV
jgi:hypothetical protein